MTLSPALAAQGLSARALVGSDAQAVYDVMAAQERHDLGAVEIELADIVADWQRPSFDVSDSTVGVFDGPVLVGYAEVSGAGRGDAAVRPAYRGRGIGSFLALWMQATARRHGYQSIRMPVPENSPGDRLLASLGYVVGWTSWVLHLPPGAQIAERACPDGYTIRAATIADDRAAWTVLEDAFLEWAARERESFGDFLAQTRQRPGFEPWNLRVVADPSGVVVAASIVLMGQSDSDEGAAETEGYVDRIAVRRDQRGRGIAQAMLADAFRQARSHGATRCSLSTDSRTGALGLYEKVGMEVTSVWVNRSRQLTSTG
ncbi:MAG: GNAT family N-acetyltransferase [Nocardioides sp.]